ncbi:MAG: Ryanodine receptor Ryr, partial [Clostridiales bacterium]|nr:Ryanodine receptor Ryr [Clostridiales bacterium]
NNDEKKTHPCLVPYSDLPETEKDYDRNVSQETLKLILFLGYEIKKTT